MIAASFSSSKLKNVRGLVLLLLCLLAFDPQYAVVVVDAKSMPLKSKSHYLVEDLGSVVPAYDKFEGDMYAGLIPVHNDDKAERQGEIMFWLFAPHKPLVKDSMVLWLNGGPGCSSFQCGNLFETGPVAVELHPAGWCCGKEDEPLIVNQHAWTNQTYMLYVEQPMGVGFSWGPWPETEDDVADDMVGWFHNFYQIFQELQPYDFYIFGESYAGMYAPAIARGIYHDNLRNDDESTHINLQGIGLGNGWIDVQIQGPAVIDYAWWHGMIDHRQRDVFMEEWKTCFYSSPLNHNKYAEEVEIEDPYHIFTTPDECGIAGAILRAAGQDIWKGQYEPNTYDVTTWDTYPVIQGANTTTFQQFYNNPDVQRALHAPNMFWEGCIPGEGRRRRLSHIGRRRLQPDIPPVGQLMLDHDRPLSMLGTMAELLGEAKIRILVYNADLDMSVNAMGTENALNIMKWKGAEQWATQERGIWTTATQIDKVAGYAKETDGLTFLVVRNSGHMVPYNQPENGLDLLTRFLRNQSYVDEVVPFFTNDELPSLHSNGTLEEEEHAGPVTWRDVLVYFVLLVAGFGVGYVASSHSRREGYESIYNSGAFGGK